MYPKFYQPLNNEEPNILYYLGGGPTDAGAILFSFFGNGHQCADRALTHDGAEYGVSLLQDQKWHVLTKTRGASAYAVSGFIVDGEDEAQALAAVREAVFEYLYLDGNSHTLLGQCKSLSIPLIEFFIMWAPDALTGAFVEVSNAASKRQLYEMEGQPPTQIDKDVLDWINREEFSANALRHMIAAVCTAGELTTGEASQLKFQMRLE